MNPAPVFVDTSTIYPLVDAADPRHRSARGLFQDLIEKRTRLTTTSYVLIETFALVQRRAGFEAVEKIEREVSDLLHVVWVDAALHRAGWAILVERKRRGLSLVDCVSFATMRAHGIRRAAAFDEDFAREGFEVAAG